MIILVVAGGGENVGIPDLGSRKGLGLLKNMGLFIYWERE